jgi:Ca2+-transporting ATPase
LIVATVTATNNFTKERQFRNLNKIKNNKGIKVLRGEPIEISIFDIQVGDIAILESGDQVPADGIFIDGYSIFLEMQRYVITWIIFKH